MSIDRHGINHSDSSPLSKCSFEETTYKIVDASIYGEQDNLMGVSPNIMFGQFIKGGTGISNILLDEDELMINESEIDEIINCNDEDDALEEY